MGVLFGDQNQEADFKDRLNANPHLAFGKWMNPYFIMRAYFTGGNLHGFEGRNARFMQHNKFVAGHVDFMYDVTNHWGVYNPKRVFHFIPWVGLGYAHRFENQNRDPSDSPILNAGILTAFRLSERVDFNLELQGAFLNEHFNRVERDKPLDGLLQLSAGLTFRLGKTTFGEIQPMDHELITQLNNRINLLRSENDQLKLRPAHCPECPECPPLQIVNKQNGESIVCFRINSARIESNQEIQVYNMAKLAKETGSSIKVTGYADSRTGTATYNRSLSEKRAKAVAKMLTDTYGIPASRIIIGWEGSDKQPYETNHWNRVVIMSVDN